MNILQVKKYYLLIKAVRQNKRSLSPLEEAFEKQIRTIEDQGQKQISEIEEHEKQLAESNSLIKKYDYDTEKDSPTLLKQKEIFNKVIDKRHHKLL